MAIYEKPTSRSLKSESGRSEYVREYSIVGPTEEADALMELVGAAPPTQHGLYRRAVAVEPVSPGIWHGTATYGDLEPPELGTFTWAFEAGTQTVRMTQAKEHIRHLPDDTAPPFDGVIGVTEDGRVEGVEIFLPRFEFSETYQRADVDMTFAYRRTIMELVGKVNHAPFKGFAKGEVLFLGCSGTKRGMERWEVTYRFACSENATNLEVAPGFVLPDKEGWHVVWVFYKHVVETLLGGVKVVVKKPTAVYQERVYDYGNFSLLGIGV